MNSISAKNWRASGPLTAGLLLVIAPHPAAGQSGPAVDLSNVGCLERLELPEYPPLPRTARIQVIQTVKVLLSDQATVRNLEQSLQVKTAEVERSFKEGVEKALQNSRFSKTCGGKTITLVFHYEFREDDKTMSLFAFGPPNHFWIRYGPVYVMP